MNGQLRYRISEQNLYAYWFGIKRPIIHVMAYFVAILRQAGVSAKARKRKGADIDAACGQLRRSFEPRPSGSARGAP